ncbi:Tho1 protein [Saccharomycopsis crataegensis]|uniref:Tho1 protein n=1 Tax=Saccharomycopsis crataegensis TaxID=43959 RepID=A0AAV5QP25_9ASCO|nr:Tho1 protein [Saccharomycopsis crataegensis]
MSKYSSQTVAQLKELLKAKGLSTNGVKSDLVARLEEADSSEEGKEEPVATIASESADAAKVESAAEEANSEKPKQDVTSEEKPEEGAKVTTAGDYTIIHPSKDAPKEEEEKEEKVVEEEKPKELSPEELKSAAVELLNKKIEREKKFGGENSETTIKDLEKSLARIEKFGITPESVLAKEIGLATGTRSLGAKTDRVQKPFKEKFHGRRYSNKGRKPFNRRR